MATQTQSLRSKCGGIESDVRSSRILVLRLQVSTFDIEILATGEMQLVVLPRSRASLAASQMLGQLPTPNNYQKSIVADTILRLGYCKSVVSMEEKLRGSASTPYDTGHKDSIPATPVTICLSATPLRKCADETDRGQMPNVQTVLLRSNRSV